MPYGLMHSSGRGPTIGPGLQHSHGIMLAESLEKGCQVVTVKQSIVNSEWAEQTGYPEENGLKNSVGKGDGDKTLVNSVLKALAKVRVARRLLSPTPDSLGPAGVAREPLVGMVQIQSDRRRIPKRR